jgi:hypothetical protein
MKNLEEEIKDITEAYEKEYNSESPNQSLLILYQTNIENL